MKAQQWDEAVASILNQTEKRLKRCKSKILTAIEGSEKKRITLSISAGICAAEPPVAIDVTLRFKDKEKRDGLDVTETYRDSGSEQLEDPNQPTLFKGGKSSKKDKSEGETPEAS